MKYNGISPDNFATLIEDNDTRQIESDIIDFILSLKEKHYSIASQKAYLSALIHFYSMNDVMIRWKKIAKFLSNDDNIICSEEATGSSEGGDVVGEGEKPYTREEIAKLLEFSDLREKVIIFWCLKNSAMIIANRVLDNKN